MPHGAVSLAGGEPSHRAFLFDLLVFTGALAGCRGSVVVDLTPLGWACSFSPAFLFDRLVMIGAFWASLVTGSAPTSVIRTELLDPAVAP